MSDDLCTKCKNNKICKFEDGVKDYIENIENIDSLTPICLTVLFECRYYEPSSHNNIRGY
jgi:hypothetical protein